MGVIEIQYWQYGTTVITKQDSDVGLTKKYPLSTNMLCVYNSPVPNISLVNKKYPSVKENNWKFKT